MLPTWLFIATLSVGMFLLGWSGLQSYQHDPGSIWITLFGAFALLCGIIGRIKDDERATKRRD